MWIIFCFIFFCLRFLPHTVSCLSLFSFLQLFMIAAATAGDESDGGGSHLALNVIEYDLDDLKMVEESIK